MPALSADERARLRADLAPMVATTPTLVSIARAPQGAAKRGGAVPIATAVPMMIWPADGQTAPKELQIIPAVAGARVSALGYALAGTDVQIGDTVQAPATAYKVVGVAVWNAAIGVALNEIAP